MKNLKDVLIDYCYQDIKTEMDLGGIPTRDDIPNISHVVYNDCTCFLRLRQTVFILILPTNCKH